MRSFGTYEVLHSRGYRGHAKGLTFTASLDGGAEARAIRRGDIRLIERTTPSLQPGSLTLPRGWLNQQEEGKP